MSSLNAVVWCALARGAEKQWERGDLADGSRHEVKFSGAGSVDGVGFVVDLDAVVKVGHGGMNTRSVGVDAVRQLAYVLELVELAFSDPADPAAGARAVGDIVSDVLAKFAECGSVPASDKYVGIAADLDKALRVAKPTAVAGAVRVDCGDADLSIAEPVGV
jgi:hypothetical protein